MADEQIKKSGMTGTIGEHISAMAQAILREEAVLSSVFRYISAFRQKGVDRISYPAIGKFTVNNRAHGGTTNRQAPAVTVETLHLDQLAEIKYGIDGASAIQSTLNWKLECAKIAAQDHVDFFESKLLAALETYGTPMDSVAAVFSPEVAVEMRKKYLDNKGKVANAVWVISTECEADILSNSDVYKAQSYGSPLIKDGVLEKLYGIPVVVRLGLSGNQYYLAAKEALIYGFQMSPAYAEQADLNYGTSGVLCVMDQLFGVGASYLSGDHSRLIIKDNN